MQLRKRKLSRKLDCTMSASQTSPDLNVPDSFIQSYLWFVYSFSFLVLSSLEFSLPKFRFLQRELSSLVPVPVNRHLTNRVWRTVELPLWGTDVSLVSGIWISWFQGLLQQSFSQTQLPKVTTAEMAKIIWDVPCRVGEHNTAPAGDPMAIWRWRSGRILEGI